MTGKQFLQMFTNFGKFEFTKYEDKGDGSQESDVVDPLVWKCDDPVVATHVLLKHVEQRVTETNQVH